MEHTPFSVLPIRRFIADEDPLFHKGFSWTNLRPGSRRVSIDKANMTAGTQQQRQHQKRNDPMVDWLENKNVRAQTNTTQRKQCLRKFVESLSTMVGGALNASWRNTFWARPSVPRVFGRERCRRLERETGRAPKTISHNCRTFKFQQRLKRHFSKAAWNHWAHATTCRTNRGEWEEAKRTVPAQVPASRVSKNPGGNNRQERMNAVSGRKDRRHRADKRVGLTTKKSRAALHGNQEHVAHQREGPSGQHLADFDTLPSAVVKVPRASWYGQHAIVVTIEKLLTRGKNGEGLDCLVQKLAITWWQWCHTSTFWNPDRGKCTTECITAHFVDLEEWQ